MAEKLRRFFSVISEGHETVGIHCTYHEVRPLTPGAVEKPPTESPAVALSPLSVSGFYGRSAWWEITLNFLDGALE